MPMFKPYGLLNHQLFTTFENLPGTTPDLMIFPGSSCGAVLDISLWILLDRGVGQPPCNPNSYVNLCHIYISSLIMLIYQRIIYIYICILYIYCLVVDLPLWKMMEWTSLRQWGRYNLPRYIHTSHKKKILYYILGWLFPIDGIIMSYRWNTHYSHLFAKIIMISHIITLSFTISWKFPIYGKS